MPREELIPVPLYGPNDPYHYTYDNIPLKNILRRQHLINLAVDDVILQMRDAIGTQGTVANRLDQSINPDGSLKTGAIDATLHDIGSHTDSDTYVRMLREESDKLALIADEATNFAVEVQLDDTGDNVVLFDAGKLRFVPTDTASFAIESPNKLKVNFAFPSSAAHRHFYDNTPVHDNLSTPDFIHYKVNSIASPYIEGSLRVYVNGTRLSATESIYVPGALTTDPDTLLTFIPDHDNGTFALSAAVSDEDVIRIDYDLLYE